MLVPDSVVYLKDFSYRHGKRKLLYDLIAVIKGNLLINMDSKAPNKVAKESGYQSYVLFVIQMSGMKLFTPNDVTHREFGDNLRYAAKKGVHILDCECAVTPDNLKVTRTVPIELDV